MQTLLQMPTSPECPERRRLAHEVAETVALVFELKKRQREASKKHEGLSILFNEARIAQQNAEQLLANHIKQHGCRKSD